MKSEVDNLKSEVTNLKMHIIMPGWIICLIACAILVLHSANARPMLNETVNEIQGKVILVLVKVNIFIIKIDILNTYKI